MTHRQLPRIKEGGIRIGDADTICRYARRSWKPAREKASVPGGRFGDSVVLVGVREPGSATGQSRQSPRHLVAKSGKKIPTESIDRNEDHEGGPIRSRRLRTGDGTAQRRAARAGKSLGIAQSGGGIT